MLGSLKQPLVPTWSIMPMTPIGFALMKDMGTTGSCIKTSTSCVGRAAHSLDAVQQVWQTAGWQAAL